MIQKLFIVWASWNIGRELVNQVITKDTKKLNINPSLIVWVANSKSYIFDWNWISLDILIQITKWKNESNKIFEQFWTKINNLNHLLDLVKDEWLSSEAIFIDVTAWKDELLDFHKNIIWESQNYLVTANKNPISLYTNYDFEYLNKYKWRYDTNTTVMWWAWVLNFVDERVNKLNDKILKIEWMFSWTLGYIMSELDKQEKTFSKIVIDANQNWYTEPNPWDDLNWLDVARKLIILARYCSYQVDIKDVELEPLIDEKYSKFEWEDFLKEIQNEDNRFKKLIQEAKEKDEVLRYLAEFDYNKWNIKLKVWLKSVPKNSDLWRLSWTSNIAIIETEILKQPLPHIIKSRWAWISVTAASVRLWIAKMLPNNIKTR